MANSNTSDTSDAPGRPNPGDNNPQPAQPGPETGRAESDRPTDAEIDERMAYIDGVNGSAGHHLDDPHLRDLLRRNIAGEITAQQYRELGMEHLRGQVES